MDKQSHHTLAEYTVILFSQCPAPHTVSLVPSVSGQGEGLLSALSLGHQAAIVATATDLRVRGQGGCGGGRQDRGSVRQGRGDPWEVVVVMRSSFDMRPVTSGLLLQV